MTRNELLKLMKLISAEYPNTFKVSHERVAVWWEMIGNADFSLAWQSVLGILREPREFPPSVGMVAQAISDLANPKTQWGDAWNDLISLVSRFGTYGAEEACEKMDDRTRRAVGGVTGFRELCATQTEALPIFRAQFRQRYEAAKERSNVSALPHNVSALISRAEKKQIE